MKTGFSTVKKVQVIFLIICMIISIIAVPSYVSAEPEYNLPKRCSCPFISTMPTSAVRDNRRKA